MGVANKTTGQGADPKKKEQSKAEQQQTEEQIKKNLEARQEFELNELPVKPLELYSWYGFDWANSVYPSVVMAAFLPIMLAGLADAYACPYEYLPKNPNGTMGSNSLDWNGHANSTTTCTLVGSNHSKWDYNIFGDNDHGFDHWPLHQITYYDSNVDPFYEDPDGYKYLPSEALVINCHGTGDIDFEPIRNVTYFATKCKGGKDLVDTKCKAGTGEVGSFYPPEEGSISHVVYFASDSNLADFNPPYDFTVDSSNEEMVPSGYNRDDGYGVTNIETLTEENGLKLDITPFAFRVGSGTIRVVITSPSSPGKVAYVSFTFNGIAHEQCPYRVPFLGMQVRPVTFASQCTSLSVFFQAFLFGTVASYGDFGPFRKLLLCYFSLIGSVCVMLMFACSSGEYYLMAGLLTIISNGFYGASHVMYSAYLPYISRSHPRFLDAKFEYKNIKTGAATGVGKASKKLLSTYHDVQDEVSADGYFWGYVAGCLGNVIGAAGIFMSPNLFGLRLVIFIMGFWWFVFALPLFAFVKTRPGPPFPSDINKNPVSFMTFSWRRILAAIVAVFNHLPETKRFVISYFLFSDGYNTIAYISILFAMNELGMQTIELIILSAEAPFMGAVGMRIFRYWQVKYGYSSKQMLVRGLYIMSSIPVYGFLGMLRTWGWWAECPVGLVQKNEMYFLCIAFGIVLGPTQSYARTFFTDLIPPGQEAEYFGVFEISDRGSSWMGPLICGLLYENLGSLRYAMFYLLFVNLAGLYMVVKTDDMKGSEDCRRKEVMVRMAADRKRWGIEKSAAPPSAKKMIGLKSSKKTGMSTNISGASSVSSMSETKSRSSFSVFNKKNKVHNDAAGGFGGATVVEDTDDAGGFGNATVVEDTDGGGFGNATVVEDTDGGGFGNATVVEDTGGDGFGNATVVEDTGGG